MRISESKVVVFCSHAKTGGPELLHQLVHELNLIGRPAFICFYPFNKAHCIHKEYGKYKTPVCEFNDDGDTFFVIPESATFISRRVRHSTYSIWWLSVDNYFRTKNESLIRDFIYKNLSLLRSRVPMNRLRKAYHFTQSEYARNCLQACSIDSIMLTDYLGIEHFEKERSQDLGSRKNVIVYNPKKGITITKKLINRFEKFLFVPIQNMSSNEVVDLLNTAKVYIDFGNHPGKDRLPREAAMSGCCIVTNTKGSARNSVDISIANKYKLDEKLQTFELDFQNIVETIFLHFEESSKEFVGYRRKITNELDDFQTQVKQIFL